MSESSEDKKSRTVVLPVDASEHCSKAFDWYAKKIHNEGDKVVIIHAQEMPPMPAAPYPYGLVNIEQYQRATEKNEESVRKLLQSFGKRCAQLKNTTCKLYKQPGHAGQVLCKVAHDENADMIVMGTRGLGNIRRTILGSVSDYIVHHADVPVTIVPPAGREGPYVPPSPSGETPSGHHGVKESDIKDPSVLMS